MAKSSLTIPISQPLLEAMKLEANDTFDYFTLLGVSREVQERADVDRVVMERSKVLRKWQTSSKYGEEVVRLLSQLHRAAQILKDPKRRQAYREELERLERGETRSPTEVFTELVRAALADNQLDSQSRLHLSAFAGEHDISADDAQGIVAKVKEEIKVARAAEQLADQKDDWEFRLAVEGEEGFSLMLAGMENSGQLTPSVVKGLIKDAGRYKLDAQQAGKMINEFLNESFKRMVKRVAGGGFISDDQATFLVLKASAYGLEYDKAYAVVADFTLSAYPTDQELTSIGISDTFSGDDIEEIVSQKADTRSRHSLLARLTGVVPTKVRNGVLIALGLGALAFPAVYLKDVVYGGKATTRYLGPGERTTQAPIVPAPTVDPDQATQAVTPQHQGSPLAATPAPTTTPGSSPPRFAPQPDPPSGMLAFHPVEPDDPPAFEMAINEVTNHDYRFFVLAAFEQPPDYWDGAQYSSEMAQTPVTNVTWHQAKTFCPWLANVKGWRAGSVRLPTRAEYLRAMRGVTRRGNPLEPNYWSRARFHLTNKVKTIKTVLWDKIHIPGSAQMYDLVGNVAEWGEDELNGQRIVLGGDHTRGDPNFNHLEGRFMNPNLRMPNVGFRYVRVLEE